MDQRRLEDLQAAWANAETLSGHRLDETIRPATAAPDRAPARAIALPRIELSPAGVPATDPAARDLVLCRVLGEGGMGRVHLAEQRSLGREVAVKTVRPEMDGAHARAALLFEGRVTGLLEHPSVVPIYALGVDGAGRPMLVMKRVQGTPLSTLLGEPDHPAWSSCSGAGDRTAFLVRVLVRVCHALEAAHERDIFHCDVKPENIMLGAHDEVYLLDWGVAVQRSDPRDVVCLVGTPAYMAPEMVVGEVDAIDERTDVYLLGATLHDLLTGQPRHTGAALSDVLLAALGSAPVSYPPTVPRELGALANAATSCDPTARPPNAAAFREALTAWLDHRASTVLADAAQAHLDELERLGATDADTLRALTEARFGFLLALRTWPGNADAKAGLDAVTERMIEREIRLASAAGARTLLAGLGGARPDLEARVAALEDEAHVRARRFHAVEALRREMDPSVSQAAYARLFGLAAVVVGLVATTVLVTRRADPGLGAEGTFVGDAIVLGTLGLVLFVGRKRLLANALARRLSRVVIAQGAFFVAIGLAVYAHGGTAVESALYRLLALGLSFAVAAFVMLPSLLWLAAICAGGALVIGAAPAAGPYLGPLTFVALLATSSALVRFGRMRAHDQDVPH